MGGGREVQKAKVQAGVEGKAADSKKAEVKSAAHEKRTNLGAKVEKEKGKEKGSNIPEAIAKAPDSAMKKAYEAVSNLVEKNPKLKGPFANAIKGALAWAAVNMDFFPGKFVGRMLAQGESKLSEAEAKEVLAVAQKPGEAVVNTTEVPGMSVEEAGERQRASVLASCYAVFGKRFPGVVDVDGLFGSLAKVNKPGVVDEEGKPKGAFKFSTSVELIMGGKLPKGALVCLAENPMKGKMDFKNLQGPQKFVAVADGKGNMSFFDGEKWVEIQGKDVGLSGKYMMLTAAYPDKKKEEKAVAEKKAVEVDAKEKSV